MWLLVMYLVNFLALFGMQFTGVASLMDSFLIHVVDDHLLTQGGLEIELEVEV